MSIDTNQDRLWPDTQELGRTGRSSDDGITRLVSTPQSQQIQDWLETRIRDAGLAVGEDAAGNLIGRLCGSRPEKPCVIYRSHYDIVPGGGQFDGTFGILSALEAMRRIREQGTVIERTIRPAAFKDEEESRFGYGIVGGKSIYGILDPEGLMFVDEDGISLEQAMAGYGCRLDQLASCKMEDVGTYLRLHIKQGKMLEDHGTSIGVVSGIAGLVRYTVKIRGESGHAGATPMRTRKDPIPAMCRWTDRATELTGARESCAATVGSVTTYPEARNVICKRMVFSLDLRSIRQKDLRKIVEEMEWYGAELFSLHGMEMNLRPDQAPPPHRCHEPLREAIKNICWPKGYSFMELMSGAGHDRMNFKDTCPTTMIFVSSEGGVSHRKEGFIPREDCVRGARVLLGLPLETVGASDKID